MESLVARASRRALRALLSMRCLCFNKLDLILRRPRRGRLEGWAPTTICDPGHPSDRPGINPPLSFVHTQKLLQSLYFAGHNESSETPCAYTRGGPDAMISSPMHL